MCSSYVAAFCATHIDHAFYAVAEASLMMMGTQQCNLTQSHSIRKFEHQGDFSPTEPEGPEPHQQ
jgi:hypothetical protein